MHEYFSEKTSRPVRSKRESFKDADASAEKLRCSAPFEFSKAVKSVIAALSSGTFTPAGACLTTYFKLVRKNPKILFAIKLSGN